LKDLIRMANEQLKLSDSLIQQFEDEESINDKRQIQKKRLSYLAKAAMLFHKNKNYAKEAASQLYSSSLLIQLMINDPNAKKRYNMQMTFLNIIMML